MAGAGGGPPRKSHTKSRNGCQTCKNRHIRCDETFPQCRNCTKHNCRCAYMDLVVAPEESATKSQEGPDLLMSPEIEVEIENWHLTGVPPFPELLHCPRGGWSGLSRVDLRLIHHIVGLSIDLHRRDLSNCTIWAPKMPNFLALGLTHSFVMSSILALSASHLAWMTQNKETQQVAACQKAVALTGLQKALNAFSRDNCDAVLAAAILLSWQATEWSNWVSLQRDISSVLDAMHPVWKQESDLAKFLGSERAISNPLSPTNSAFSLCDEEVTQLDQTITTLENLCQTKEHSQQLKELVGILNKLRKNLHTQSPEEAFKRAQPLRAWLLWFPSAMLRGGDSDVSALAVLAQLYGSSVTLDIIHPDMGGAFFGPLSVGPVDHIYRIILEQTSTDAFNTNSRLALALADTSQQIVTRYKHRFAWSPRPSVGQYSPTPSSHYTPDPPGPFNGISISDCPAAFSAAASNSSVRLATHASPLPSPPVVTTATSSFPFAGSYATPPLSETTFYPPSPHLLSEHDSELIDMMENVRSSAYTAAFMDSMLYGGTARHDTTAMELPLGIYNEHDAFYPTGMPTQEVCWT